MSIDDLYIRRDDFIYLQNKNLWNYFSALENCTEAPYSNLGFPHTTSAVVTIPEGTVTAIWNNPGDQYEEISFEIYASDGSLLLAVGLGEGTPGLLPVTNCL